MTVRVILKTALSFYQNFLSPLLHRSASTFGYSSSCRFPVSCSEFAREELLHSPSLASAVCRVLKRFWFCSPWGGVERRPDLMGSWPSLERRRF